MNTLALIFNQLEFCVPVSSFCSRAPVSTFKEIMKSFVSCHAKVLIPFVCGIPLSHQREKGSLFSWVGHFKCPHRVSYLSNQKKILEVFFSILEGPCRNPILPDPAWQSPSMGSLFDPPADVATPSALPQHVGQISETAPTTLPPSYLCFLSTLNIWTSWGQGSHFIHLGSLPRSSVVIVAQ